MNAQEDIRDIDVGSEYWIVTDPARGGRCAMVGMFIAAWRTRDAAKKTAVGMMAEGRLTAGHSIVRQVKE